MLHKPLIESGICKPPNKPQHSGLKGSPATKSVKCWTSEIGPRNIHSSRKRNLPQRATEGRFQNIGDKWERTFPPPPNQKIWFNFIEGMDAICGACWLPPRSQIDYLGRRSFGQFDPDPVDFQPPTKPRQADGLFRFSGCTLMCITTEGTEDVQKTPDRYQW